MGFYACLQTGAILTCNSDMGDYYNVTIFSIQNPNCYIHTVGATMTHDPDGVTELVAIGSFYTYRNCQPGKKFMFRSLITNSI